MGLGGPAVHTNFFGKLGSTQKDPMGFSKFPYKEIKFKKIIKKSKLSFEIIMEH